MLYQIIYRARGRAAFGREVFIRHHIKAIARQVAVDNQRVSFINCLEQNLLGRGLGLRF